MTNFYTQVKQNAKKKVKDKNIKKVAPAEEIEDGAGVYDVDGINVKRGERNELMPTWVQGGAQYHINLKDGDGESFHVTHEGVPKIQYFFKGSGTDIKGVQPSKGERGKSSKMDYRVGHEVNTKRSFNDLPDDVQNFIRDNWADILG
jgi:hypothetical protein